jgi:ketosteroid isomerase-like protein
MSEDNVEVVRRFHDALNGRDTDLVYELLDPEVIWITNVDGPDAGTFSGHDGFGELRKLFENTIDDVTLDADEFIDLGDRVVSCGHMRGRGASSGASIETPRSWLWTVRDGRIVRHRTFTERSDALDAARAQEQPEASHRPPGESVP